MGVDFHVNTVFAVSSRLRYIKSSFDFLKIISLFF